MFEWIRRMFRRRADAVSDEEPRVQNIERHASEQFNEWEGVRQEVKRVEELVAHRRHR